MSIVPGYSSINGSTLKFAWSWFTKFIIYSTAIIFSAGFAYSKLCELETRVTAVEQITIDNSNNIVRLQADIKYIKLGVDDIKKAVRRVD